MSDPLDMEHPLWQLYLIDGLRGGRHAYLSKTHHALVDGVAAVDIGMILLDPKAPGTKLQAAEGPLDARRRRSAATCSRRPPPTRCSGPSRPPAAPPRHTVRMPAKTATQRDPKTAEAFTGLAAGGPVVPEEPVQRPDRPRPPRRLGARPTSTG